MVNAFTSFWKNYFNFKGRATRSEYGYMLLWYLLITVILNYFTPLFMIWIVITIIPWLALQIRRYRDVGFNNWGIGLIYIFNTLLTVTLVFLIVTIALKVGTSFLANGLLTMDTIGSKESFKEVIKQYADNETFIAYMSSIILEGSIPLILFHIYVFFYQVFLFVCSFLPTNFLVGKSFFDFTRKEEPKDEVIQGYLTSEEVSSGIGKQGVSSEVPNKDEAEALESSEELVSEIDTDVDIEEVPKSEALDTPTETEEEESTEAEEAPKSETEEEESTEVEETPKVEDKE